MSIQYLENFYGKFYLLNLFFTGKPDQRGILAEGREEHRAQGGCPEDQHSKEGRQGHVSGEQDTILLRWWAILDL